MNINFMKVRKLFAVISLIAVVGSVVLLGMRGLNLGLDFTGGTQVELSASEDFELEQVRASLAEGQYGDSVVKHFGSARDILIRIPPRESEADKVGQEVYALLADEVPGTVLRRVEYVGPQVGDELRDQSGLAMLMALGLMLLYVWFRFSNKFGVATVLALFHDVIVVLGIFSLLQWEFDLTVLAAVLALIGYSLNDTIVVADRVRETFQQTRLEDPEEIINLSINQTFSRTIITSLTTLLVLTSLLVFGGAMIRSFAEALTVGVIIGTYSSIYIASNVLMLMKVSKEDFIVPSVEEVDEMP